ncbi:MAG: hypothetical protein KKC51_08300 [Verrucomicrobia bacterium]|nr:hypothetical protein [Verrucomicrobiota bacterium]
MPEIPHDPKLAAATDIIFDCPFCGKNLAIDLRGASLMVICPDCGRNVQVPEPAPGDPAEEGPAAPITVSAEALASAHTKIERLVSTLEEIRDRRRYLEHLRTENMARFEQIGGEVEVIQNSLDRIVSLLQEAVAEKMSGSAPPQES